MPIADACVAVDLCGIQGPESDLNQLALFRAGNDGQSGRVKLVICGRVRVGIDVALVGQ